MSSYFGKSQTAFGKSQTAFGKSHFLLLSVFLFIWVFFSLPIVEVYDNSTTTNNSSYKCTNDNGKTYIMQNPNTRNKDINSENGYSCMRINHGIDPESITFNPNQIKTIFSIIMTLPPTANGYHHCILYDDYGFLCDEVLCKHLKNKNQSIDNLTKTNVI